MLYAFKTFLRKARRRLWTAFNKPVGPNVQFHPKRILLLNGTHVGDLVISTSLLPVLKAAYPGVEIGFVVATWSKAVVDGHPLVSYVHSVDHWTMNRSGDKMLKKLIRYWRTRTQAVREVKERKYDLSVSLHAGYPDFLTLAWQAGISNRVAFNQVLWAPLATLLATYPEKNRYLHQGACQSELLWAMGIDRSLALYRRSSLAPDSEQAIDEVCKLVGIRHIRAAGYSVIHMGAGLPFKELPLSFWKEMAASLSQETMLVFTGRGTLESDNVEKVIAGLSNCINACNKLSWKAFVAAVRHAEVLYGVDSMAGHVAGAVGTPCNIVSHGASGVFRWRPEGIKATIWTHPTPCSPCGSASGCATMECLTGVKPQDLLLSSNLLSTELLTTK